ncbi:MAG TPA: IPTL-CTERM sorting domain-containing protein [Thermoanaerobaculia bacterium]|nr:IPTL-CTERM sorting domain-containing protein [Thermoanaerobaculia bacterium]
MRAARWVFLVSLLLSLPLAAQTFVFDLRGSQEVPPVPSTHSGGCMGVLDQPAATFSLTCVHDVIGATVMHIHRAPAEANGEVVFDLGDPASPVTATWTGMTAANIADLLANNLYVNIHTAGRPAGEIRGQILARTVDTVPFTADGGQVVPPNPTEASASCTADLDGPATSLAVSCTHNLPSPSAAHIHRAPFGQNGPIVFTFPNPLSINASVPLTPEQVAAFAAAFLYLDIHGSGGTEDDAADEIRGQIGTPPAGAGTGTIVIAKETDPAGGSGFGFTENITPGTFTLNDGGTRTFTNIAPGTYSVSENAMAGYTLGDLACDDANSTGDPFTRTATVRLEAGEVVQCTFRNFASTATDSIFVFHLSGDQEVPPVVTPERGGCMGRFRSATSSLSLVCTHDVVLPTLMHIHRGEPEENGPVVFDMGQPDSPVIATWDGMTPAEVADLFAGNFYVNIHTSGRPGGAIRGQIVLRTVDTVSFPMSSAQTVPPGTSPTTGNCTADLDTAADVLAVSCTHNMAGADAAHVHDAPRGQNGPIVFTFPSPASPFSAGVPMTPRLVADFAAGFLYVDVHGPDVSEDQQPDQIRGQIAEPVVAPTTGTIRILKSTSPAGGTNFPFTQTITNGAFTLDDGGEQLFSNVPAGRYTVTEGTVAGWSLTDVTCGDGDSTGNAFSRTATINLQGGEIVTCTFRNLQSVTAPTRFVFHLSGNQEVPPTDSTARGGCYGQLDTAARSLSLVCTHNVSSPAVAHIHRAPAGSNGPIVFDVGDPASPIEAVWTNMTPAEIADLQAGNYYLNIHAAGRPDGEIRGQILPRTVDAFSFSAAGSQEVPPTPSTATGSCSADLSADASFVGVQCTHNVAGVTATHLHVAPPGVDGPAIFDFPNTSTFSGNVPLTPRLVADFAAGFLYVNIHSAAFEEGEIRGQLIAGAVAPAAVAAIPTLGEWALLLMMLALAGVAFVRVR